MYQLSHLLKSEYEIYWITFSKNVALPPGEYRLPADVTKYRNSKLHQLLPKMVPPQPEYELDHITFLGQLDPNKYMERNEQPPMEGTASYINGLAKMHSLDCVITLFDITRLIPDVPFDLPVVAWVPLHSATVRKSSSDYWMLRHYHGAASLAPSSARAIELAVGDYPDYGSGNTSDDDNLLDREEQQYALDLTAKVTGKVGVEFIPHIIDRLSIVKSAEKGLNLLEWMSVAHADSVLSGNPPIMDRGQERTLEAGHERSLFRPSPDEGDSEVINRGCGVDRKGIDQSTFVVLMQGGNYDGEDRKGWDTHVQGFTRFYHRLQELSSMDDDTCHANVHLHIHSMESYLIESDANGDMDAPPMVLPGGHQQHKLLHYSGLPRDVYTLDLSKHQPEIVAAYKARASVCLHASKVEGFGMNVLECQAAGTPVITTNYTAMGDFTKLGRAVDPLQMIKTLGLYEMALPDVGGIADALMELYLEHNAAIQTGQKTMNEEVNQWIDTTFSPSSVRSTFLRVLASAEAEYMERTVAKKAISYEVFASSSGYALAQGYHTPIADWDAPWTLLAPDGLTLTNPTALDRLCWEMTLFHPQTNLMVLPADDEILAGGINENTPLLVRTFVITGIQGQASRRVSLVGLAMQLGKHQKMLPAGLATMRKQTGSFDNEREMRTDQL